MEQAQEAIKVAHLIVRDKIAVCKFYHKRLEFFEKYGYYAEETPAESLRSQSASITDSHNKKRVDSYRNSVNDESQVDENYMTEEALYNNTEKSISITEKTARKLLPVYKAMLFKVQ